MIINKLLGIKTWILYLIIGLLVVAFNIGMFYDRKRISKDRDYLLDTQMAIAAERDSLKKDVFQYLLKVDDMRHLNDDIMNKMLKMKDSLKIKDSLILQLGYIELGVSKTDTIAIRDTIFKDPNFHIDTIIGDKYYTMELEMRYPNFVRTKPTFAMETYIVGYHKKEFVKTPSKIFFVRWFLKKRTVTVVTVVNDSPYVNEKNKKFVEIIK